MPRRRVIGHTGEMSQTDDSSLAESIPTERARRSGWQSLGIGALTLLLLGIPGVLAGSEIAVEIWGTDCSGHSDTRVGAKAGIDKRVAPHGLRHSMAHDLMWEGVPLVLIQQQLGHSSLATTERYVNHLAPRELVETMQRRREFQID